MKKEIFTDKQLKVLELYVQLEITKFSTKKKNLYSEIQKRTKYNLNTITSWIRRYLEKYKEIRKEIQEEKNAKISNFEGLTEKQTKYVMFRMCGFSKEEAKLEAGYSEKTKAANIEKNPKIIGTIVELREKLKDDVRYGVMANLNALVTIRDEGIKGVERVEYTDSSTPDGHSIIKTVVKEKQFIASATATRIINEMLGYKLTDELKLEEAKKKEKAGQLVLIESGTVRRFSELRVRRAQKTSILGKISSLPKNNLYTRGGKMQQVLATENRIAKLFQFSERKVRDYFKAARIAPGKYDLLQVIEIFVEKNSGKDETAELKRADKDLKEYKLQILKKEYHHESDVVRIVSNMNYNFKSKLMAIPSKISVQLLNKNNQLEIEDILKKAVINVLEELVDYKYEESEFGEDEDTGETYNKID